MLEAEREVGDGRNASLHLPLDGEAGFAFCSRHLFYFPAQYPFCLLVTVHSEGTSFSSLSVLPIWMRLFLSSISWSRHRI